MVPCSEVSLTENLRQYVDWISRFDARLEDQLIAWLNQQPAGVITAWHPLQLTQDGYEAFCGFFYRTLRLRLQCSVFYQRNVVAMASPERAIQDWRREFWRIADAGNVIAPDAFLARVRARKTWQLHRTAA